jgi:hypothetical protein
VYENAAAYLALHADLMQPLVALKAGEPLLDQVVDSAGTAGGRHDRHRGPGGQRILTRELEQINSLLCGPCNCTLCCVGPEQRWPRPISRFRCNPAKSNTFSVERIDSPISRALRVDDEPSLQVGQPRFFRPSGSGADPLVGRLEPDSAPKEPVSESAGCRALPHIFGPAAGLPPAADFSLYGGTDGSTNAGTRFSGCGRPFWRWWTVRMFVCCRTRSLPMPRPANWR